MDKTNPERKKSPDFVSSKQIGRAAADGQKLAFHTGVLNLSGYVVGADAFHWLVASITPTQDGPRAYTALVHKSCPVVVFTPDTLDGETDEIREMISGIGSAFWEFCRRTYAGSSSLKEQ